MICRSGSNPDTAVQAFSDESLTLTLSSLSGSPASNHRRHRLSWASRSPIWCSACLAPNANPVQ